MAAGPRPSLTEGSTILLFGPQVLSFNEESFKKLHAALSSGPQHRWMLKVIAELPAYWQILSNQFPQLASVPGEKLLTTLKQCFDTADYSSLDFQLPNVLLTPLVVVMQVTQYTRYLELKFAKSPALNDLQAEFTNQNVETLGFCTGLLSALAVSSSSSQPDLETYGAVAVRLAMLIGALVDAQDASARLHGRAKSYAVAWKSSEQGKEVKRIIDRFPEAYTSVQYDEKRTTVTTAERTAPMLLQQLKSAGIVASEVGLRGRFHCDCYNDDIESLVQFCSSEAAFRFPDASQLALPVLNFSLDEGFVDGNMHQLALRAILVEQSRWYQTFANVQPMRLKNRNSVIVSIGPDRCVPPSLMRELGPRLIHVADLDQDTPQISASVLDPEAHSRHAGHSENDDIAVIGMSCKVAGADDIGEFSEILKEGKSQHIEVPGSRFGFETHWREIDNNRKWYGNFINDVDTFDHKFFKKSPRESASQDPQQRLMLQAAYQAVEQSGYFTMPNVDRNIGCYIGACAADYEHNVACYPPNAFTATGNLKSFIPGKVAHYFGWTGPGMTVDTACSASAVSIHLACRAILNGECSGALAGGVATMSNPLWFQNLAGATFLSPTGQCKPFDESADGYCRGEGIACVFLKKMSAAIADGNQIFGCVASTSVNQNQNCTPLFVPNSPSLSPLFRDVLRRARLEPEHISVVEAHGTGTPVGDPAEYESIRLALAGPLRTKPLPIGSVKGHVGHTEGASGVISLIKILLMMHDRFIPPQASFSKMSHNIKTAASDMLRIPTKLEEWDEEYKAALINNYGASGSNASMVVTQSVYTGQSATTPIQSLAVRHPFWITGFDQRSLGEYCEKLVKIIRREKSASQGLSLANLSFNVCRQSNPSLAQGLVCSSGSLEDLEEQLTSFASKKQQQNTPTSIKAPRPVVLCFGGQISTFVGLDTDIYNSVKLLRTYLDECDSVFRWIGLDGIYPDIFQRTPIENQVKLQTVLFALQYSCAKCWIDCGANVVAVVGHSFGELTALCVSGSLSLTQAAKLVTGRAKVIRELWGEDRGAMTAIEGDLEDVERLLTESNNVYEGDFPASIACYNGPHSFTLAGSTKAIETVADMCLSNPIFKPMKTKRLNVSNAFHSTLVEPLMSKLADLGREITFKHPTIPFERATESASTKPLSADFVAEHMRYPVYFNHAVHRLAKAYPSCIWLEAGSCSTITTMANRALGSNIGAHFQAVNITSDNATQNLTHTTVSLWKEGLRVSFWAHHTSQTYEFTSLVLPPYQFEKARHWLDLKKPREEIQQALPTPAEPHSPLGLWTFVGYQDKAKRSARFRINTMTQKYQEFVTGHLIAKTAPICPATLEVDMAVEALLSIVPEAGTAELLPQVLNMRNHIPICVDPSRQVWIEYEALDKDCLCWVWKILSNGPDPSKGTTVHVDGKILLRSPDDVEYQAEFARFERIIGYQRCCDLLEKDQIDDEVIQGHNIYKTFAEIVDYSDMYRGLRKIVGRGNESAGRVLKKYTAETYLDPLLSDCFSQVGGIWVNCMTDRASVDMFIASGCDKVMRSPKVRSDYQRPEVWDVFAHHHKESDKVYLTDLFVFDSSNGRLMEVMLGIHYAKVPKASMSKILSRLTATEATPSDPSVAVKLDTTQRPRTAVPAPVGVVAAPAEAAEMVAAPPQQKKEKKSSSRPDISNDVRNIIATVSGLEAAEIQAESELADFGIDSLMGMELAREVQAAFKCSLDQSELMEATNFQRFVKCIQNALGPEEDAAERSDDQDGPEDSDCDHSSTVSRGSNTPPSSTGSPPPSVAKGVLSSKTAQLQLAKHDILDAFAESKMQTDQYIVRYKINDFVGTIMAKSNQLCVALVVEAFETLGCSLKSVAAGQTLERIQYEPQHERLVEYLYSLLEKDARLINLDNSEIKRTVITAPTKSSETLLQELLCDFPEWRYANKLTYYAGKHLAGVLSGETDGIKVIFGSAEARQLVSGLYCEHSFNKMSYNQMKDFIGRLVSRLDMSQGPLKILEMGAGTGGTTLVLAPFLASLNIPVEYTFTDISASMIAQAKRKFKAYPFMRFAVHDIEKVPPEELLGQHMVIASNAVHATHSLTKSGENIREALRPDGFLLMLEMTDIVPFIDIIFGLLEGWWLFDDGRRHAIAPPARWERDLQSVGYGHVDWTDGQLPENEIQKVIIAMASGSPQARLPGPKKEAEEQHDAGNLETLEADIASYVDKHSCNFAVPVAKATSNPSVPDPSKNEKCFLVTGATGSLGSHIVASLAEKADVACIVCVNRRSSTDVKTRQHQALTSRGIKLTSSALAKLKSLETDTSKPALGLPNSEYEWLVQHVTHILHNAWPMSGTRPVKTFEPQFQALRNLVDLARDAACYHNRSMRIGFELISSIGVVGHYPHWSGKTYVPEERMDVRSVLRIGYCEAKLTCERILDATLHQYPQDFRAMTARPGQIAGSRVSGYWNPVEHLPFLLKSSQSLRALPDLEGTLSWVPVNDVAETCVDLLLNEEAGGVAQPVYHIDNPVGQPWKEMIRVLADEMHVPVPEGILPFQEWVKKVRASPLNVDTDNPAARLIGFLDDHFLRMSCGGLILDTKKTKLHSKTLAGQGPISAEIARGYVQAWKDMRFFHK